MNHRRRLKRFFLFLLLLLVLIAGCAQLPEYAQPRLHDLENNALSGKEGFGYQRLAVKDFQAKDLPSDFRQYNHRIGARSCISIRPSRDSKIRIVQSSYYDMSFYVGTISQLTFEAIFVPECSWWNPELAKGKEEYILQHEQIHFALTELAARKLTSEAGNEIKGYPLIGNTFIEVQEEIKEKLQTMIRKAMEVSIEEQTDFDEDTSMFYDPQAQQRWLEKVDARLGISQ